MTDATNWIPGWLLFLIAVVILAACLASPVLPFLGTIITSGRSTRIPAVALQGVKPDTATLLWWTDLDSLSVGLPPETVLGIAEVVLADGSRERRVFLSRDGQPSVYLGPLKRHAPAVPVEMLFADLWDRSVIAGCADPAAHPVLGRVDVYPRGTRPSDVLKLYHQPPRTQPNHCFVVMLLRPTPRGEEWDTIERLVLHGSGDVVLADYAFAPPLDTRALWMRVP